MRKLELEMLMGLPKVTQSVKREPGPKASSRRPLKSSSTVDLRLQLKCLQDNPGPPQRPPHLGPDSLFWEQLSLRSWGSTLAIIFNAAAP